MAGETDEELMAGKDWGFILPDGNFRALPKRPMILGGYGKPPFDVELPSGEIRHIIESPDE